MSCLGRATLISGPKRQSISHQIPIGNRSITATSTTASSPSFSNIEHIRRYSLSRTHSEQPSNSGSRTSTPSNSRRTSTSDSAERLRSGSYTAVSVHHLNGSLSDTSTSNSTTIAPKSLREWHEQPVNLLEQSALSERVNVQILSPNSERVTTATT